MPRRAFYNTSSIQLGDPEVGTTAWSTEYDIEFADKHGVEALDFVPERPNVRTPRSLKKGFVHVQDYETMEGKFSSAVSAYQDLQLNLAALEQRLSVLNDKEDEFLHSVAKEHNAVQDVRDGLIGLTESLSSLLTSVERNRSLMGLLTHFKASPPAIAPTQRALAAQDNYALQAKMATLEARVGEMAGAVTAMAAAHTRQAGPSREGKLLPSQGMLPRRPATRKEKIEQLPYSRTSGLTGNDYWKP